jgi:hypothetical protein
MLRITVQGRRGSTTIKLEGKFLGPWVEGFSRTWHSLAGSLGSKELHLDLCGVAFVDVKGKQLLSEIYQRTNASLVFLTDSPVTQYFADDAMQQSPKDGEEGV